MGRAREYRKQLDDVLKDDEEALAYLNAAPAEGDPDVFLLALGDVTRARSGGIAIVAESAQLNREHLY